MATLVQQAVDAAIRLSFHTREEAYAKGLTHQAIDLEVQILQEVADNGKTQEERDRAKRTINQLLWNGGRKYTFKPADMKVAA
jgi:cell division protein FtsB